ncbi:MAG: 50S ribosomal protein L35, partial [Rhodoluna sp.]|nr:50S ribosomal protein L35 [Rhodoluna sp.]
KRFRFTGSGKIMKQQINMRHNQEHMSNRRKRRLNVDQVVSPADYKTLKTLLGK